MAIGLDKDEQYTDYSSSSAFASGDALKGGPTTTRSLASSASSIHSSTTSSTTAPPPPVPPLPPSGYTILRKTPRTIASIEQFDFKSFPEQATSNTKHPTPTLPSSSGLTNISSFSADTFTTLMKQPTQQQQQQQQQQQRESGGKAAENNIDMVSGNNNNNNNTIPLESLRATRNSIVPATEAVDTMLDRHGQRQQLQDMHTHLMTCDGNQDPTPKRRQRNYQVFPGNSTFFCGGRFMTSQAYWAFIIAFIMLVAPSVLFGIFTCPFLWSNLHPLVPILYAYMFAIAIASMFKVSWTDPGVIPRGLDPTPTLESYDDHSSIWTQPFPADRCVKIKDEMWNLKYCGTCKIYRPPRASHCRQCDNCVENDDHHCIWLNNCIGKRNYRPFFTFIVTCTLMAIYLIVFTVLHLFMAARQIRPDINFDLVFQTTPVSFVLAIVGVFLLWMVGGLTSYHCHLVWKGVSTHEKLRSTLWEDQRTGHPNPYGKTNPLVNIIQILCRPQPKSHLRRRKYTDMP